MKKYIIDIDEESCWGCRTCEAACKQEFNMPSGVNLISLVEEGPKMTGGKLDFIFRLNLCRHCDDPPCRDACPEGAIYKRDDSIVVMDYDRCTGCRLCLEACPYGSIDFDEAGGIARKCNLCHHRVDKGLIPACADNVCLAHCIYFGEPGEIEERKKEWKRPG